MRHLNTLHLCLKLQREWDPDVCMIQQCASPGTSSESFVRLLQLFGKQTFKMNDTEHECSRIVFKCVLKSSHMLSSYSIMSIGLISEAEYSIFLLDVCPTLFFTRGRITLMKPVYPWCFRPTLTFYLTSSGKLSDQARLHDVMSMLASYCWRTWSGFYKWGQISIKDDNVNTAGLTAMTAVEASRRLFHVVQFYLNIKERGKKDDSGTCLTSFRQFVHWPLR